MSLKKGQFFSHRFENGKLVLKLRSDGYHGLFFIAIEMFAKSTHRTSKTAKKIHDDLQRHLLT